MLDNLYFEYYDEDEIGIETCTECGKEIRMDEEHYVDIADYFFCSEECILKYHNIRRVC